MADSEKKQCAEYISQFCYPASKINKKTLLEALKINGKLYYPIVGWDPDAISPSLKEVKVPPFRKWLNKLPKKKFHSPVEDRTYILYG